MDLIILGFCEHLVSPMHLMLLLGSLIVSQGFKFLASKNREQHK